MRAVPIIRSRTGCFTCRRRKKKCNEEKPMCSGCKRNKLECHWPAELASPTQTQSQSQSQTQTQIHTQTSPRKLSCSSSRSTSTPTIPLGSPIQAAPSSPIALSLHRDSFSDFSHESSAPDVAAAAAAADAARRSFSSSSSDGSPGMFTYVAGTNSDEAVEDVVDVSMASPAPFSGILPTANNDPETTLQLGNLGDARFTSLFNPDGDGFDNATLSFRGAVPMNVSMMPSHDHDSFELLSYYLARTANSMGNGSTDVNPFVAKLIPLAFSDPLVLHLILAQSAVHRQASKECSSGGEIAQRYYTDSLRMFRNVVGEYVSGKDSTNLVVTVGSLILCLTEVARGDVRGTIFDHLTASKSLLTSLLSRSGIDKADDLTEFLVEYYMHMLASSMISKDPRNTTQSPLSPGIEAMTKRLLEKNYIGQLCGCWLEMLLMIPQVFQLGQSMLPAIGEEMVSASPDSVVTFGLLQSQILAFLPSMTASPNSQLAGLVWKQAALLYLWSIFGTPHAKQNQSSMHTDLMNGAVMEAVSVLNHLPAAERVNTSLCWPLTVIGCCTTDPDVQQTLRGRLQAMIDLIGLGNMRETLVLLEHVWEQPPEEISPWTLRNVMQKYQTWISFA